MAGTAPPNYPEGRHPAPANVRQLQNRLWIWFHDQGRHKLMGTIRYPKAA